MRHFTRRAATIAVVAALATGSIAGGASAQDQVLRIAMGSPGDSVTSVFEDIALAHREIYALYEIAQAMGSSLGVADTMALISSKLSNIVPFSCCALYLYTEESESLHCRFATGVESDIVQQLTIRNGHGLTGWVARNRRPLVNARGYAVRSSGEKAARRLRNVWRGAIGESW